MAKNTKKDQVILNLQSKIQEKKDFLIKSSKPKWLSNMVINIPGGPTINIHTLNEDTGINALAMLINYREALLQAISLVPGCKKTTDEVCNWMKDVLTKLEIVNRNNLIADLAKDEKELEELLSDGFKQDRKLSTILDKYNV